MMLKPLPKPINDNTPDLNTLVFKCYTDLLEFMDAKAIEWPSMPHDEFNARFQALMLKNLITVWPEKYHGE
jgi:hypothetical protein